VAHFQAGHWLCSVRASKRLLDAIAPASDVFLLSNRWLLAWAVADDHWPKREGLAFKRRENGRPDIVENEFDDPNEETLE
jgi:hypothetical protein